MQKVITFFIVSAILFAIPELLSIVEPVASMASVAEPGTIGAMSSNIQELIAGLNKFISIISYITGLIFAVKAFIALKEYNETGGTYSSLEKEKVIKEPKIKVPEIKVPEIKIQKLVFPINDKKIELLIEAIKIKSKDLLSNPQINSEIELKYIAEKSVSAYLPKVIDIYTNISPELRKKNLNNELSAHDMTCQQLELIHAGLCEIELKLLSKNNDKLKVSGKFLNQIFKEKEKIIELEM